jgi:hypothetical protein
MCITGTVLKDTEALVFLFENAQKMLESRCGTGVLGVNG